ncbi:MAG: hypothetical protein ACPGUI_00375 [Halarcobacter sp.]
MNDKYVVKFFKYVDRPMLLFLVEVDDFLVGFLVFFILMLGSILLGITVGGLIFIYMILGGLTSYFYYKYKQSKPTGYTLQFLYKLGYYHPCDFKVKPTSFTNKGDFKVVPTSLTKKFVGQ